MFSKEFMRYLINYQPDGFEQVELPKESHVKEISFKSKHSGYLAKEYLYIKK